MGLPNQPENRDGELTGLFGSLLLFCAKANVVLASPAGAVLAKENVDAGTWSSLGSEEAEALVFPNENSGLFLASDCFEVEPSSVDTGVGASAAVLPNENGVEELGAEVDFVIEKVLKGLSGVGSLDVTLG